MQHHEDVDNLEPRALYNQDGNILLSFKMPDTQFDETPLKTDLEITENSLIPDKDPILSRLENVEKYEAAQTGVVSLLLSTNKNIYEKLAHIEKQIAGLQKDAQLAKSTEKGHERLLENYVKIGAKYYRIEEDEPLDWYDALAKCKSLNGSLLSIQNLEEWIAVTAHLSWYNSYWVDINDLQREGEFISETSGRPAPFLKWDIFEPNNMATSINNEDCVELRSQFKHYMNDINCFDKKYYVCEAKFNN